MALSRGNLLRSKIRCIHANQASLAIYYPTSKRHRLATSPELLGLPTNASSVFGSMTTERRSVYEPV